MFVSFVIVHATFVKYGPHGQYWRLVFNSSPPSAAYMRKWTRSALFQNRWQAITWTNAELLSIGLLVTNFSEILIKIRNFSFIKIHLKMSSSKWRPFCPGGDELTKLHLLLLHDMVARANVAKGMTIYGTVFVDDWDWLIGWLVGLSIYIWNGSTQKQISKWKYTRASICNKLNFDVIC